MSRKLKLGISAKDALESGISQVADTVKVTLGPNGRNVMIDRTVQNQKPIIINDGISIAKEILLEDEFENIGARLMIEAATKANELAGDGSTSTIVLTQELIHQGFKNLAAGANPVLLRRGMKMALHAVTEGLKRTAKKVSGNNQILRVAQISSKSTEFGELIAKAMHAFDNQEAFFLVHDSKTMHTTLELIRGMRLNSGYLSKAMCTDKNRSRIELDHPHLLITEDKVTDIQELLPIMRQAVEKKSPLILIAKEISESVLGAIVLNKAKGIIDMAAINLPGVGQFLRDSMEDLAVYTGAVIVEQEKGLFLKDVTWDMLGQCSHIQIDKDSTILAGGYGENQAVRNRISKIEKRIEESDSIFDQEKYRERIAKISGNIAIIHVGAESEAEVNEYKLRIEDAIASTKLAVRGGVIPGGGSALIHLQSAVDSVLNQCKNEDEKTGALLLKKALERPLYQICFNAGIEPSSVIEKVKSLEISQGFDAVTEEYVDMYEKGIVDPLLTEIHVLESAVSIASTLLTSEAVNIIVKGSETFPAS